MIARESLRIKRAHCIPSLFARRNINRTRVKDAAMKRDVIITRLLCFFVTVFPNVPPAPGMPCQGEDSEFPTTAANNQIL